MNQNREYNFINTNNNNKNNNIIGNQLLFFVEILINSSFQNSTETTPNNFLINNNTISHFNNSTNSNRLNEDQKNTLRLISKILCSFSIAGLLFVLFMFTFFRSVRSFVLELAVWLCFTNLFFNINVYFPIEQGGPNGWCLSQGLISTFSDLSTMIWTTLIGFFSYFSVVKSGFIDNNKKNLRLVFILIAYFIPGIFTLM